jgi:hypothetical protein
MFDPHGAQKFGNFLVGLIFGGMLLIVAGAGLAGVAFLLVSGIERLFGFKASTWLRTETEFEKRQARKILKRVAAPINPHLTQHEVIAQKVLKTREGAEETNLYYSRKVNEDLMALSEQHEHEKVLLVNPQQAVMLCLEPLSKNCRYLAGVVHSGGGRLVWQASKVKSLRFRLDSPSLRSYVQLVQRAGLEPYVVSSRAQKIRQGINPSDKEGTNHDTKS